MDKKFCYFFVGFVLQHLWVEANIIQRENTRNLCLLLSQVLGLLIVVKIGDFVCLLFLRMFLGAHVLEKGALSWDMPHGACS